MIKSALSLNTVTILGVALLLPLSALAQTVNKKDSILEGSNADPSVHIDLGILEQLTAPKKKAPTKPVAAPETQAEKQTPSKDIQPPQKAQQQSHTHTKSRAIKDQEKALDALEQKYFPERYAEKVKKRKAAEKTAQETQAKQAKLARQKKEQERWNKRRIAARKKMPLPTYKPHTNRAAQHKSKTIQRATTAATPKVIDLTSKPTRTAQPTIHKAQKQEPAQQLDLTSKPKKAAPISTASNKTAQGKKLVSIAYVDKEININANVQNALKNNYLQKMIEKRTKHIGLYSYATTTNKTQEQALDFAKKRAQSLKRFLVNAGVRSDMIEIHTNITNDSNNFSDWIDIIQQK